MTLHETNRIPDDWRLVHNGICDERLRSIDRPETWQGVSAGDAALLREWLARFATPTWKLYTDVPFGCCPAPGFEVQPDWFEDMRRQITCLRVDAIINDGQTWTLLEIKPDAGYVALGQVLTYQWYAPKCCPCLENCVCAVLTDNVQPAIEPIYQHFEIPIIEVGLVAPV